MPRKRLPPNDPREWLGRAQSNLARAANPLPDAYLEDFCFDAQQAAEKAIKAVFMAHGLTFPYIHDLGRLLTVLAQPGVPVPQYVQEADQLTRFAVDARYPGLSSPVTKRAHRRALRIATGVLRRATRWVDRLCP
jgi:HEPN domain-containing protein